MEARIIEISTRLFSTYGIKSITMDEISKELGMSKKTIYQYFEDKKTLINAVVEHAVASEAAKIAVIENSNLNPIEEMFHHMKQAKEMLSNMNVTFLYDLQKYFPMAFAKYEKFKFENVSTVEKNLERGIKLGLYMEDINVKILAKFRVESVDMGFDPRIFNKDEFTLLEIQLETMAHFLRGILSPKGLEIYNYTKKQFI